MLKKILLLIIFLNLINYGSDMKKIFPYKYHKVILKNGFKAILIPLEKSGLVAYYSVVRTGSRDEWEEGKSGFAHFFEHMMFRGTERFPGNVYDSIITSIGANANAYTDNDLTVYHLNFAKEDLEKVIDLEADRFQNLKYNKEQFQTESGAVYGEYRKGRTNPWAVAYEKLQDLSFDKHTYKHTTIGFEKDIKDMPNQYEYSLGFYQRYYRPENVVVLIVGDFDLNQTKKWIANYYQSWKGGYVEPKIEKEPEQTSPKMLDVKYEGKTLPLVLIGYKADEFDCSSKNFLASVPFSDLAFGETSEFYKKLVLDEQKVQTIFASPSFSRDPFLFQIGVIIKNEEDINYVISEIKKTIDIFKNNLVNDEKLNSLKKRNKYSFLMALDSPDNIASILPFYITVSDDIDVIDKYYYSLDNITSADIQSAVKNIFKQEKSNTIILKGSN